ncbi:VWA domain-containing protein [Streptomyces sp. NPDC058655]|uniref:VWA domain-containing protein n=1 Tax=Streptomyces sp. NPDC058655 TaxID=3346577 RepID=UPI003646973F
MGIRSLLRKVFGRSTEPLPETSDSASAAFPSQAERTPLDAAADLVAASFDNPTVPPQSAPRDREQGTLLTATAVDPTVPEARRPSTPAVPQDPGPSPEPVATPAPAVPEAAEAEPATAETAPPAEPEPVAPAADTTEPAPAEPVAAAAEAEATPAAAEPVAAEPLAAEPVAAEPEPKPVAEPAPVAEPEASEPVAPAVEAEPEQEPAAEPEAAGPAPIAPAVEAEPVAEPEAAEPVAATATAEPETKPVAEPAPVVEPEASKPVAPAVEAEPAVEFAASEPEPVAAPEPVVFQPVAEPETLAAAAAVAPLDIPAPEAPVEADVPPPAVVAVPGAGTAAHAAAAVRRRAPGVAGAYKAAGQVLRTKGRTGARAKVYLVLDRSGSMRPFYKDGSAQHLADHALALAAHLDDAATVHTVFFSTEVDGTADLTLDAHSASWVQARHGELGRMGRTSYHAAVQAVVEHYQKDGGEGPALVLFQIDGAPDNRQPARQALAEAAATAPGIRWQFVAFGDHDAKGFDFARRLDAVNAGFFHAGPAPAELPSAALLKGVLDGF